MTTQDLAGCTRASYRPPGLYVVGMPPLTPIPHCCIPPHPATALHIPAWALQPLLPPSSTMPVLHCAHSSRLTLSFPGHAMQYCPSLWGGVRQQKVEEGGEAQRR